MDWFSKHWLQLLFVGMYLAMLAWHGWLGKRRTRGLDDFLVGGRRMGGVVIGLSFYATFVSSVTFVGHAGRSYAFGLSWWLICVVVFTSMVLVSWFVIAPPFTRRARELGALTVPDFLGFQYESLLLRRLAGGVVVIASLAYMVAVYEGATRLLGVLLDLDPGMVTMIIFVVVTAYTLAGGFHSVVATDAVQGVILLAGGMLLPLSMVVREGGVTALLGKVRLAMPSVLEWQPEGALAGDVTVGTLVGLALGVGLKIIVEPRQLSRFYGLADDEQLRRGRWIAPAMLFVTYLVMLPVGFLAHAFGTPGELGGGSGRALTDNVIPHLLGSKVNLLGPVAGAFFLTGLVAAAMSSIDSVLLVAASSADHDLVAPGRADDGVGVRRTRVWVFLLSAVAAVLSLILDQGITEMSSFSGSLYAACFLPSLIVGLFWKRLGRTAALLALITGFATTLGWFILKQTGCLGDLRKVHEVYVGVACSHVVAVTMTVLGRGGRR
ncbi:MAG: hypothetical protein VX877_03675 [Planctomycetota bacterium]|nr:hypothetical protein [Planctomycetota bacterium]